MQFLRSADPGLHKKIEKNESKKTHGAVLVFHDLHWVRWPENNANAIVRRKSAQNK
jgi:hypothetical protein